VTPVTTSDADDAPTAPAGVAPNSIDGTAHGARRRWWRVAGSVVGCALVALAVGVAFSRAPMAETIAALAQPDRATARHLVILAAATLGGIVLSGEILLRLTRRFGDVGRGEMLALVAASTLLNYLPLRPGLLGRVVWHRVVNGIPSLAIARTVVEATAITVVAVAALVVSLMSCAWLALPWSLALVLPMIGPALCAVHPRWRVYAVPAALRHIEIVLWAVRLHAAFALVGVDLAPTAALGLTAAAVSASMIPIVGNGLGVREWTVGLLSPVLADVDLAVGISADLIGRAIEIGIIVPVGLVAIAWLARRRRTVFGRSLTPSE